MRGICNIRRVDKKRATVLNMVDRVRLIEKVAIKPRLARDEGVSHSIRFIGRNEFKKKPEK